MEITTKLVETHIIKIDGSNIEFLLLKRASDDKYPNIWQMVTGTIEKEEKAYDTAKREVFEETGLTPKSIFVVPTLNSFYSYEPEYICLIPVFVCVVEENSEVVLSNEHSEYKWVNRNIAKELLSWPQQRNSVDIIFEYFSNSKSLLKFIEVVI